MIILILLCLTGWSAAGWYAFNFYGQRKRFRRFAAEVKEFNTVAIPPAAMMLVLILAGLALWKKEELKKFLAGKLRE